MRSNKSSFSVRISVCVLALFWTNQILAKQETMCEGERPLFHCDVARGGAIALCPSYLRGELVGVQYRFWKRGVIELAYPQSSFSFKGFRYNHYFRSMTDYKRVSFSRGAYTYSLYANYNGEESFEMANTSGVTVSNLAGTVDVNIACIDVHVNSLQRVMPYLKCDAEDALGCGGFGG